MYKVLILRMTTNLFSLVNKLIPDKFTKLPEMPIIFITIRVRNGNIF